jgi:hypothetical protein
VRLKDARLVGPQAFGKPPLDLLDLAASLLERLLQTKHLAGHLGFRNFNPQNLSPIRTAQDEHLAAANAMTNGDASKGSFTRSFGIWHAKRINRTDWFWK